MKNRKIRAEIKAKGLGYYHLCTDGLKEGLLFYKAEHFAYAMLLLGMITLKFGIVIYAFSLMPNHIHIIIKGTGANALKAFDYLSKHISSMLMKDGYPGLKDYGFILKDITTEQQMKVEIVYVHRNGYEKGFATPGTYMWSSGWLYYSHIPQMVSGRKAGTYSRREWADLYSISDRIPDEWRIHPTMGLLPQYFIDTSMVDNLFRGVKEYMTMMVKEYEAFVLCAKSLNENPEFSQAEIKDIVNTELQRSMSGKQLNSLSQDEKCKLVILLSAKYDLSPLQISRAVYIKESLVRQILQSKDYKSTRFVPKS